MPEAVFGVERLHKLGVEEIDVFLGALGIWPALDDRSRPHDHGIIRWNDIVDRLIAIESRGQDIAQLIHADRSSPFSTNVTVNGADGVY